MICPPLKVYKRPWEEWYSDWGHLFLDFPLNLQLLTPCASTATTLVASAVAMAMAKAGVALTGGTQLAEADTGPIDFTEKLLETFQDPCVPWLHFLSSS